VSLLVLSLGLIAAGVPVDFHNLLRIKEHLVRVLGFNNISLRPSMGGQTSFVEFGDVTEIPEAAYPCIHELIVVLDSRHALDFGVLSLGLQGQDGTSAPLLVGSAYVDMFLSMFCSVTDLSVLPPLTMKCMLEALTIIIYKQDFEKTLLRNLKPILRNAVNRALHLLLQDISYECRQQALSVVQAYTKRWHGSLGNFIQYVFIH
jgi:hypothetical protein